MSKETIEDLESYYQTENDHWNEFILGVVENVLAGDLFVAPLPPVEIINDGLKLFIEQFESPMKALNEFIEGIKKHELTNQQEIFIVGKIYHYINISSFENDLTPAARLLKTYYDKIREDYNSELPQKAPDPKVKDIHLTLKKIVTDELAQLPELLKGMDPVQRAAFLVKILPVVMPKFEAKTLFEY